MNIAIRYHVLKYLITYKNQRFFKHTIYRSCMYRMRKNHVSGRFTIVQPGITDGGIPDLLDFPTMSMINREGILQKIHGYDDEDTPGSIRVYESHTPIVSTVAAESYTEVPLYSQPAYGYHYLLTMSGKKEDSNNLENWTNMMVAIQDRLRWLYTQKGVGYVTVFTDIINNYNNPIFQMISFKDVPPMILAESKSIISMHNEKGVCAVCQLVREESRGPRLVIETEEFVAFCPWSPLCPYATWIVPKRHSTSFLKVSQRDLQDLGLILRTTLGGIKHVLDGGRCSVAFHFSPERKNTRQVHWHAEVYPDTVIPTSLDRSFGISVCSISPEDAATELGAAVRNELVDIVGIE